MTKKREASAPAENTVREDYDPDEWGNIELPGLSDEELHSKDWHRSSIMLEINKTRYGHGTYEVRSPGCDLVDFYDVMMKRLDPTSKAWSYIPPSVVYHYRYEHEYPPELFDKSKNYGRNAYLRDSLKHLYDTTDATYWAQIYNHRYKWLRNTPSERKQFRYRNQVEEYLRIQNAGKGITGGLGVNSDKHRVEQMWWRGNLAGWSVVWTPSV